MKQTMDKLRPVDRNDALKKKKQKKTLNQLKKRVRDWNFNRIYFLMQIK